MSDQVWDDTRKRYRVECLASEDGEGHVTWALAARRGQEMDNGPAVRVDGDEAIALLNALELQGSVVRIIEVCRVCGARDGRHALDIRGNCIVGGAAIKSGR